MERLNESLNILTHDNSSLDTNNNKMYTYGVLAWQRSAAWKPILQVIEHEERLLLRAFVDNNYLADEESTDVLCDDETECPGNHIYIYIIHVYFGHDFGDRSSYRGLFCRLFLFSQPT